MAWFFASGHAADLAVGFILIEAGVLWRLRDGAGRRRFFRFWPFLAAGACLMLALRAALVGAPWWCVAFALALSGVAHALDVARRW